jgi:hypothetical protein
MHEPLYRPVLRDAFQSMWRNKTLWPLALGAGILLTGSISGIVGKMVNVLAPHFSLGSFIGTFWARATVSWAAFTPGELLLGSLKALQISAFFLILAGAIAGLSVICQGALVHALGMSKRPRLKQSLAVGAKAFWPVAVLNLMSIAVLVATRSLLGIALGMAGNGVTAGGYFLYLLSFGVFTLVAVSAVIIQIFALNAMILQGATLLQGIERGALMLQRHWVIVFEVAAILFVIGIASWVVALLVNMIVAAPFFVVLVTAAALGSSMLLLSVLWLGIALFVLVMLTVVAAVITLQYAAWTFLFRRLGEGGAVPKLHRIFRGWTNNSHVPGA